jgi:hypothetical protein
MAAWKGLINEIRGLATYAAWELQPEAVIKRIEDELGIDPTYFAVTQPDCGGRRSVIQCCKLMMQNIQQLQ